MLSLFFKTPCTLIQLFPPARLGGLALLIAFTWEISSPPIGEISGNGGPEKRDLA